MRSVRSQTLILLGARLFATGMQAVAVVLLGRTTSPAVFGEVAVVLSLLAFAAGVADLGTPPFLAKSYAEQRWAEVRGSLRLNRLTTAALAVLAGLVVSVEAALLGTSVVLGLLAVSVALEKNSDTALSVPVAQGRSGVVAINLTVRRVLVLVVFVATLLATRDGLLAYVLASLAGAVGGQVHVSLQIRRSVPAEGATMPLAQVARRSFPYAVGNITAQARSLDSTIIGAVAGTVQTGLYAAASRLTSPFALVPGALAATALPHSTRLDRPGAQRFVLRLLLLHAGMIACLLPVAMFAAPIMELLFGHDYLGAAPSLAVLAIGVPIIGLSSVLGSVAQGQHLERMVAVNGTLFAGVTLAALWVGALLGSSLGAALGLVVSYAVKCVALLAVLYRPVQPAVLPVAES